MIWYFGDDSVFWGDIFVYLCISLCPLSYQCVFFACVRSASVRSRYLDYGLYFWLREFKRIAIDAQSARLFMHTSTNSHCLYSVRHLIS